MNRAAGVAVWVCACLAVALSGPLAAQDSQFGVRGLGVPGRLESVRARSTGGAFAAFDPLSALLDAALGDIARLSAGITTTTSWRRAQVDTLDSSLRGSRFPTFVVAGPVTRRIIVAGGFSTYLDKSWGVRTQSTDTLRGQPVGITDELTSDGAVSDLRLALAARASRRLAFGVAVHGLTGSTRVSATRTFSDTAYRASTVRDEVSYGGFGMSASAMFDVTPDLRIAAWARNDTKLRADIRGRTVSDVDLPFSAGGAVRWRAGSEAVLAGSVAWRYWQGAGPNAFDTFQWSLGTELGSASTPLRLGVRGGTLPFGPAGAAPTELGVAGGIGKSFSGGRGRLDIGLERLERKGGGLAERTWTLLLGLAVRP